MGYQIIPSLIAMILLDLLHMSFAWKLTVLALITTDIKTFPLVWHLRLLNALRFVLPSQRTEHELTPNSIFQPLVTSSHCSLSEMDFNWHKSNSTYLSDLDISRTHLLCTLFSIGINDARNGRGLDKLQKGRFTIKLGAVNCSFKREIKPYQRYEMWSRVLTWDQKWLYTITHFTTSRKGKDALGNTNKTRVVCATAVSKCVFKSGRQTISPIDMLRASGLLPPEAFHSSRPFVASLAVPGDRTLSQVQLPQEQSSDFLDDECNEWMKSHDVKTPKSGGWTSAMIENERRRGMAGMDAGMMDLDYLEQDFCADVEVLGRHFDL